MIRLSLDISRQPARGLGLFTARDVGRRQAEVVARELRISLQAPEVATQRVVHLSLAHGVLALLPETNGHGFDWRSSEHGRCAKQKCAEPEQAVTYRHRITSRI